LPERGSGRNCEKITVFDSDAMVFVLEFVTREISAKDQEKML